MASDGQSLPLRSSPTHSICTSSGERVSNSTSNGSATDEQDTPFIDEEYDPLIPSLEDVHRIFHNGKATWEALLTQAKRMPQGLWPRDALNPYVTLVDVPSLPEQLSRSDWLHGRPCWKLPNDIGGTICSPAGTSHVHGRRVSFRLQINNPIRCDVRPNATSFACSSPKTANSLAVLVLCWSYILSVRLLEMQRRKIRYTKHRLWPIVPKGETEATATADIDLGGASRALVRWLCAILNPVMGWQTIDNGHLPQWATCFKTNVRLVLEASDNAADVCSAPNSIEATALLVELCQLFDLGSDLNGLSDLEPLQPYKASFLAALALPFYNFMELQPLLPRPRLVRSPDKSTFNSSHKQQIYGYLSQLRYFMTLSVHPPSIGSIIWSVFWQPDVNCNLVGPWLASVWDTLESTIVQNEVEVLLKVFLSRRPRIGIWWVALFLLGDPALFDWIRRYTIKMKEKRFGSLSSPDPMVSVWTGSKQSFIDFGNDFVYLHQSDPVSKADLLRCRFDLKLQDSATTTLSWRPFGNLQKSLVEIELWPQLETRYTRIYDAFVWYPKKNLSIRDEGFRKCTGQHLNNVPDNLQMLTSTEHLDPEKIYPLTNTRPSKESTRKMMVFLVENAGGSRDWVNAGFSMRYDQLRWLRDWEGLDTMVNDAMEEELPKTPSWWLKKWIQREIIDDGGST
ncbi:hypothetical protein DER44DRAFT_438510 [Fusarium oxysporum]|nr:hypothetical protein DER44DRAFT_438510 [Fusarium oxysporum]